MDYEDTIRLIKEALKKHYLYAKEEIFYMKRQLDSAILGLARKKFNKEKKMRILTDDIELNGEDLDNLLE